MQKRFLSLLLCLILAIPMFPAQAADALEFQDVTVQNGVVTATLSAPADAARIFCAAYDADGVQVAVREAADPSAISVDFSALEAVTRYKLFCLDEGTMSPLTPAAELEVKLTAENSFGMLRIAWNGEIYSAPACRTEDGRVCIPLAGAQALTGEKLEPTLTLADREYVDLAPLVDSCVYDAPLASLYVWDGLPVIAGVQDAALEEFLYPELGEVSDEPITYRQFFTMLDAAVELADPDKLTAWQAQLSEARAADYPMKRMDGMIAILHAVLALGESYSEFNTSWSNTEAALGGNDRLWVECNAGGYNLHGLLPCPSFREAAPGFIQDDYVRDWEFNMVAYCYSFGRKSLTSKKLLFDFDPATVSMRAVEDMTVREAATALTRLLNSKAESVVAQMIPLDDPAALHYDSSILTPALLARGETMEEVDEWKGAVRGGDYKCYTIDPVTETLFFRKLSELGFNSVRYMFTYQTLFDHRVTQVDLTALRQLDTLVALAIRYNIHLNLVCFSVPGHWRVDNADFTSDGEFDLFTNPERQAEFNAMWSLLATRYADIPNNVLSFQPIWEINNNALSTGLPTPDYTMAQAGQCVAQVVEAIRQKDPDRLIMVELYAGNESADVIRDTPPVLEALEGIENLTFLTNFCGQDYVYAEMTWEAGANVDNHNHGMFKPPYPVKVYAAQPYVDQDHPLVLQGDLPAGTEVLLYLKATEMAGTLSATADGEVLEGVEPVELEAGKYQVGAPIAGRYPYAVSDKAFRFTLPESTDEVNVIFTGWLEWSGLSVILPEEYAVERWYYPSLYDPDGLAGPQLRNTSEILISPVWVEDVVGPITIYDDVTYTTQSVFGETSPTTIDAWGQEISGFLPGSAFRMEQPGFSIGTDIASAVAYYDDVLAMSEKYGLGWFFGDYAGVEGFSPDRRGRAESYFYAGGIYCEVADGYAILDFPLMHQKHLPAKPLPQ